MQTTDSLSLDNSLGLARALALFDGIRLLASHPRYVEAAHDKTGDPTLDAEALLVYVDTATDKVARHLSNRGFTFPNATAETLAPNFVADDATDADGELTDDEIDAIATREAQAAGALDAQIALE